MASGPNNGAFSVVRHEILDDTKFEKVYEDDAALSWWLRLLIVADKTWPAPASMPRGVPKRVLGVLVAENIISLLAHDQFIFVGMEAERARRAARFKAAADARWKNGPNHAQNGGG